VTGQPGTGVAQIKLGYAVYHTYTIYLTALLTRSAATQRPGADGRDENEQLQYVGTRTAVGCGAIETVSDTSNFDSENAHLAQCSTNWIMATFALHPYWLHCTPIHTVWVCKLDTTKITKFQKPVQLVWNP
jgi:hypothetical protein